MKTTLDLSRYWGPQRDEYSDRPGLSWHAHLPWLDGCESIVDLGCGVGNLVKLLRDRGTDAAGVTYQAREANAAWKKHGIDLTVADMHCLPFKDNVFDGMIMWDSLEHCVSPYIALCEAHRIVRPGGRGLIFIPGQNWQECGYHIIVPTQRQMRHLITLSGWALAELIDLSADQPEMAVYKVGRIR